MRHQLTTILILTGGLMAQNSLSLEDVFEQALDQNFGIRIARNQTEVSANNATLGKAGFLPTLNASAGAINTDFDGYQNSIPAEYIATRSSAGLSLSYNLFSGLSRWYGYQNLQEQSKSTALQEKLTIENTLLGVAQAYFNLVAAEENLAIVADQLDVSRERLALSRERMELGSLGRIDYLSAQVDFNTDSLAYLTARQNRADARRNLNLLLAWEPEKQYQVRPDNSPHTVYQQADLLRQALANNSAYQLQTTALDQALLGLKSSKTGFLPQINYTASLGYDQTAADWGIGLDDPSATLAHNFSLSWNLFNGNRRAQVQNAKINIKNAELRQAEALLTLERDIATNFASYENSLITLENNRQTLEAAELNFKRTRELFRLGQITALQYREAQLNLSRIRLGITQSQYAARIYELKLLQLSGRLL